MPAEEFPEAHSPALVLAAASLLTNDSPAALTLCVVHNLRDSRFRELLDTLVEVHPSHWPKLKQIADGYRDRPAKG